MHSLVLGLFGIVVAVVAYRDIYVNRNGGGNAQIVQQNFHTLGQKGINKQISQCLSASYQFLSMAHYFDRSDVALPGFKTFFSDASERERLRAIEMITYINKRGGTVKLGTISAPYEDDWSNGVLALRKALEVSRDINSKFISLRKIAVKDEDPHMKHFLEDRFIDKQVDIIKHLGDMITILESLLLDNSAGLGLYMFDQNLQKSK